VGESEADHLSKKGCAWFQFRALKPDKNFFESKCATLDRRIDQLVYERYELTPDEIAIVEGSGRGMV
jgi:hypothetical protein